MQYQTLIIDSETPIAIIRLNRPEAANALNTQMARDLKECFQSLTPSHRAVILTGAGKHFCAGADLKERKDISDKDWKIQHTAFEQALFALMECGIPVIAAVNGAAMGGGLELALACDFIYAADTARFGLTEATLGIMPGLGGTQNLPRAIGSRRAKECIFTGKPFSAKDAYAWGIVNTLCAPEKLLDEALSIAHVIAANAPIAVKAIKKAMEEGISLPLEKALATEIKYYNMLLKTRDRREGIAAFNEKRKPAFTGE